MTTLYCALCDARFEPDDDHVWLDAEVKRIDDRNDKHDYAMCMDCWLKAKDEWSDPA